MWKHIPRNDEFRFQTIKGNQCLKYKYFKIILIKMCLLKKDVIFWFCVRPEKTQNEKLKRLRAIKLYLALLADCTLIAGTTKIIPAIKWVA